MHPVSHLAPACTCRFILFLLCGILYNEMIDHAIGAFQTLYFLTSFFNQFGPNCTSFLVAGEASTAPAAAAAIVQSDGMQ